MFAGELRKQTTLFVCADCLALAAAFAGALYLHDPSRSMRVRLMNADQGILALSALSAVLVWLTVFRAFDLYRMRNGSRQEALALVKACSVAALFTLLIGFFFRIEISRIAVMLGYLLSIPSAILARTATRAFIRRFYSNPRIAIPLVIFGFNLVSRYLFDQIEEAITPYEPVGFLDAEASGQEHRGCPVLGGVERLAELAATYRHLEAAIALTMTPHDQQEQVVRLCEQQRVRWWIVPWLFRSMAGAFKVDLVGKVPVVGPRGSNIEGLNFALKRTFDLAAALVLLTLSAPLLAVAALAIWITDGRPILFRQTRIGIHGQPFQILKLRTMQRSADDSVHRDYTSRWIRNGAAAATHGSSDGATVYKLAGDRRVTPLGRLLRRFSIDELPQLINVLRGDMSLVGPRPALPYELELYRDWHRRRLDAVPGITGLWQVSGRNHLSFEQMVRLDVRYIQNWSLAGDLKIIARTLPALLRNQGV